MCNFSTSAVCLGNYIMAMHIKDCLDLFVYYLRWGARWPSGRVSDSGERGRGSITTSAVLCP